MDEVREWFTRLNLVEYADVFIDNGWDDMDTICSMSESDIEKLVPKLGHVRKLSLAIKRYKEDKASNVCVEADLVARTESSVNAPKPDVETNKDSERCEPQLDNAEEEINYDHDRPLQRIQAIDGGEKTISNSDDFNQNNSEDFNGSDDKSDGSVDTDDEAASYETESRDLHHALVHLPLRNALVTGGRPTVGQMMSISSATSVTNATIVKDSKNITIADKVEEYHIHQPDNITPCNYQEQINTALENYQRKSHLFVKTKAYSEMKDILDDRNWTVISGNPGSGKSTMAYNLMLEYSQRSYVPVVVTSVEDWKALVKGNGNIKKKQFVVIDDMFGIFSVDERKLNDWISVLDLIGKVVGERSGRLKVVCTSRKYILSQVLTKLSRFREFSKLVIVDLAHIDYALLASEKESMLRKYIEHYKININETLISRIKNLKETYGFPHCVEMFCTSSVLRERGIQFFETPIKLLEKEIQYLSEERREHFCALNIVLMAKRNKFQLADLVMDNASTVITNALKLSRMPTDTFLPNISNAFKSLNGVYIEEKMAGVFSFKHDSFKEITSIVCVKSSPALAIRMLDWVFIAPITKCFGSNIVRRDEVIILTEDQTSELVERFTTDIHDGKRFDKYLCECRLLDDDCFIEHWLKYVTTTKKNGGTPECLLVHLMKGVDDDEKDIHIPGLLSEISKTKNEKAICKILQMECIQEFIRSDEGIFEISSALVYACMEDCSLSIVETLVRNGADVNFELKYTRPDLLELNPKTAMQFAYNACFTPLISSVSNDNNETTRFLLEKGASVLKQGVHGCGRAILFWAAEYGSVDIINTILEYCGGIDKCNHLQQLYLYGEDYARYLCCMQLAVFKFVTIFLENIIHCSNVCPIDLTDNVDIFDILNGIYENGNHSILVWCLETEDFDTDTVIQMPNLIFKFLKSLLSPAMIHKCVEIGADVNARYSNGRTLLHMEGINNEHFSFYDDNLLEYDDATDWLSILLQFGLDVNAQDSDGRTPITFLLSKEHYQDIHIINWLLHNGADINIPDEFGCIPLLYALRGSDDIRQLKEILLFSVTDTAIDKKGRNCFHYLAQNVSLESEDILEIILQLQERKLNINQADNEGNVPILSANLKSMTTFLASGAMANELCKNGLNPAMHFIMNGSDDIEETIKLLVANGLDLSATDLRERNIIHYIVLSAYKEQLKREMLDMCLKDTALVNFRDRDGITPTMLAVGNKQCSKTVLCHLIANGARMSDIDNTGTSVLYHCLQTSIENEEEHCQIASEIMTRCGVYRPNRDIIIYALSTPTTGIRIVNMLLHWIYLDEITVIEVIKACFNSERDDLIKRKLFELLLNKYGSILSVRELLINDKTFHNQTLKHPSCLDYMVSLNLVNFKLFSDEIDIDSLPKSDECASKVLETLATNGIDISHVSKKHGESSSEIHFAKEGHVHTLKTLLQYQTKKHALYIDTEGNTMLHYLLSSCIDDSKIAKFLELTFDKTSNWNVTDKRGRLPLHILCQQRKLKPKCIMKIINQSSRLNDVDAGGMSALHHLIKNILHIEKGKEEELNAILVEIISEMLVHNVHVSIEDKYGKTPLMYLLSNVYVNKLCPVVELMVSNTTCASNVVTEESNVLHYLAMAYLEDDVKSRFVEDVKQKGAATDTVNKIGLKPIDCCQGMFVLKTCLLLANPIVDKSVIVSHLYKAIQWFDDFHDKPEDLIDFTRSANINLDKDKDTDGITLLSECCRFHRNSGFIEILLKHGADPNVRDRFGFTSVHRLLFSTRLLQLCLQKCVCFKQPVLSEIQFQSSLEFPWERPDVSFFTGTLASLGNTITYELHSNIVQGVNEALKILRLLLVNKADPNKMDNAGKSPLHVCAESPVMDGFTCPAMKMLIAHGADVNLEDNEGRTPLMLCAQFARTKFRRMNILIKAGANLLSKDYQGNDVSDYVKKGIRIALLMDEWEKQEDYMEQNQLGNPSRCGYYVRES